MRHFLHRVSVFFLVGWLIFSGMDVVVSREFQKDCYKPVRSFTGLMKGGLDADVIFLGSSRVLNHFAPYVLDSVLAVNSYNLGMAGAHFDDMLARYRIYREKNAPPKVVLIGVDYFSLSRNSGTNMDQFYPWFHNRSFRNAFFQARHFSFSERFLPMYRYSSVWQDFIFDRGDWSLEKGFLGFDKNYMGDMLEGSSLGFSVNPEVEKNFHVLLDLIASDGAKVAIVQTPMYVNALRKRKNPVEMDEYYENVSRQRNIPYIDYGRLSICRDTSYFVNAQHLNRRGAVAFTDSLAKDLLRLGIL
ncbi:MAG: hypothetical protein J6N54_09160 [Bacteroidales bacterium]|nr:hypothetical protein [Bacteroidales bacterium]